MKSWQLRLGVGLVALSAAAYFVHWLFFGDVHHVLIHLVGDVALVPIGVLIVTLILHRLLQRHEKRAMRTNPFDPSARPKVA